MQGNTFRFDSIAHIFFPPEATTEHTVYLSMTKTLKSKLVSSVLMKLQVRKLRHKKGG